MIHLEVPALRKISMALAMWNALLITSSLETKVYGFTLHGHGHPWAMNEIQTKMNS